MSIRVTKPETNIREKLKELDKPTGIAGEAILRADTAREQFELISAGRRRLNINGDMRIAQRGTSATDITSGDYLLDRYSVEKRSTYGRIDVTQENDGPPGFDYSLNVTAPSALTLSANSYAFIVHKLESRELAHLRYGEDNPEPLTVSFWIKSSTAGNFALNLFADDAGNRINTKTYVITKPDTWEYKTITFEGDPAGTMTRGSTGTGMWVQFFCVSGSDMNSADKDTNGWVPYSSYTTSYAGRHKADPFRENGGYIRLTGLQVETGRVATPFEHRSYGEELALCQRYFFKLGDDGNTTNLMTGTVEGGAIAAVMCGPFPTTMRDIPSVTLGSSVLFFSTTTSSRSTSVLTNRCGPTAGALLVSIASGGATLGQSCSLYDNGTDGYIYFDAEL